MTSAYFSIPKIFVRTFPLTEMNGPAKRNHIDRGQELGEGIILILKIWVKKLKSIEVLQV
jgi:hypothetical protein